MFGQLRTIIYLGGIKIQLKSQYLNNTKTSFK